MTWLAALRARRLAPSLAAYCKRDEARTPTEAAARQLGALNASWQASCARSPFASAMSDVLGLPERFKSWAEFDESVPVMDKPLLREVLACVPGDAVKAGSVHFRATGGSTGQPFRFPVFADEAGGTSLDIWLGRSRLGIRLDDPLFLIWGHAHLLGSGLRGRANALKRRLYDHLLGYTRISAYDLAEPNLRRAADRLIAGRPRYVVGYASALDRFARVNEDRAAVIAALGLKAVIATAESFPRADSRAVIGTTFGAPLFMEYGAVETGPLAYQAADGGYDVFHIRHRLSQRGGDSDSAGELLVTSLYPRALPLLRYALGDAVEAEPGCVAEGSILRLARVIGRANDVVALPTGATVHSEAFTHSARDLPDLATFQVVAPPDEWPRIRYAAPEPLSPASVAEVRRRLALVAPELATIAFERADVLPLSAAGKHRMVVPS